MLDVIAVMVKIITFSGVVELISKQCIGRIDLIPSAFFLYQSTGKTLVSFKLHVNNHKYHQAF